VNGDLRVAKGDLREAMRRQVRHRREIEEDCRLLTDHFCQLEDMLNASLKRLELSEWTADRLLQMPSPDRIPALERLIDGALARAALGAKSA
jgi:hypothetical protein